MAEAARAAGCSRALIYQRAEEDGEVAAELERIRANRGSSERSRRRHRQRDRERQPIETFHERMRRVRDDHARRRNSGRLPLEGVRGAALELGVPLQE